MERLKNFFGGLQLGLTNQVLVWDSDSQTPLTTTPMLAQNGSKTSFSILRTQNLILGCLLVAKPKISKQPSLHVL